MFDPERLLGQLLSGGLQGNKRNRRRGYGLGAGQKAALGVGALGIAIAAWEHYRQQRATATAPGGWAKGTPPPPPPGNPPPPPVAGAGPAAPPPPPGAAEPPAVRATGGDAEHLLRTMIAAAHADGGIDAAEREAIMARARGEGSDGDDLAWLQAQLAAPPTLEEIVDQTRGGLRTSTYAAALAAIDLDTDAERAWLQRLAEGLRLSAAEREGVEREVLG